MRRYLFPFFIIIPLLVFGILIYKNQNTNPQKSNADNGSPSPISQSNSINIDNYAISWFEVNDIDNLKLIPNFTEKLPAKDVMRNNSCQFLSNAGFYATSTSSAYATENTPLGLFIANNETFSNYQNNSLLDGILSINEMATPRITRNIPEDNLQIAVQSGPIIEENGNFINLKIINDKNSRRVLAAVTGDNKLFFLVIYDKSSEYSGPLLANTPNILKNFQEKSGINFADIINLDGGSASTFNTTNISLSEFNPSGAFFCQL